MEVSNKGMMNDCREKSRKAKIRETKRTGLVDIFFKKNRIRFINGFFIKQNSWFKNAKERARGRKSNI